MQPAVRDVEQLEQQVAETARRIEQTEGVLSGLQDEMSRIARRHDQPERLQRADATLMLDRAAEARLRRGRRR